MNIKQKSILALPLFAMVFLISGCSSDESPRPHKEATTLSCMRVDNNADSFIVALYDDNHKADLIQYSSGNLFEDGTLFSARVNPSDFELAVQIHPYFDSVIINRNTMMLSTTKKYSDPPPPFEIRTNYNCSKVDWAVYQDAYIKTRKFLDEKKHSEENSTQKELKERKL